jgi:uncharacterized membrane protein YkvI
MLPTTGALFYFAMLGHFPDIAERPVPVNLLLSRLGIIDLIALGYGAMTWVFIAVLAVPLLTLGAWKVFGPSTSRGNP